jgi:hypothetical protein
MKRQANERPDPFQMNTLALLASIHTCCTVQRLPRQLKVHASGLELVRSSSKRHARLIPKATVAFLQVETNLLSVR